MLVWTSCKWCTKEEVPQKEIYLVQPVFQFHVSFFHIFNTIKRFSKMLNIKHFFIFSLTNLNFGKSYSIILLIPAAFLQSKCIWHIKSAWKSRYKNLVKCLILSIFLKARLSASSQRNKDTRFWASVWNSWVILGRNLHLSIPCFWVLLLPWIDFSKIC